MTTVAAAVRVAWRARRSPRAMLGAVLGPIAVVLAVTFIARPPPGG